MSSVVSAGEAPQTAHVAAVGALKRLWPLWILATTVGYAAGGALDDALYGITGNALSGIAGGLGNVAMYGATVGGMSGILQALLLRGRFQRSYLWVLASMAGGAAGFILGTLAGEAASLAIGIRLDVYTAGAIIQFLFGAFSGASIGLAQWLLIRKRFPNAGAWVPASIVGLTLGFSIPVGIMETISLPLLGIVFGATGGLLLSLTQWLWTRRIAW